MTNTSRTPIIQDVTSLEDCSPNWNDPHWQSRCPLPGTLVYYSTRADLTITNLDNEQITIDQPRLEMFLTALILPDKTFHARLCEPNLARHMADPISAGEIFTRYNNRLMILAYRYGTALEPETAQRIFSYLGYYGLHAENLPDPQP